MDLQHALYKRKNAKQQVEEDYLYTDNEPKNALDLKLYPSGPISEGNAMEYQIPYAMYKKKRDDSENTQIDERTLFGYARNMCNENTNCDISDLEQYTYPFAMYKRKEKIENYSENGNMNETNLYSEYSRYDFEPSHNISNIKGEYTVTFPNTNKKVWEGVL